MISPHEALERLCAGNERFVADAPSAHAQMDARRRAELTAGQAPFAAVLGCADSRVPVEAVFDQGPGELFTVRIAGNVAPASVLGSLEFAVGELEVPVIVVLGHTDCGAVRATLASLRDGSEPPTPGLQAILGELAPTLEALPEAGAAGGEAGLARHAERANVIAVAQRLRSASPVLAERLAAGRLAVVGGVYELASGRVELFEGVPLEAAER